VERRIFRDCLRVGYVCRVIDVAGELGGYGIMSVGAGEAHILNVCIRDEYRSRGFARKVLLYLLERARSAGMSEAFPGSGPRMWRRLACIIPAERARSSRYNNTLRANRASDIHPDAYIQNVRLAAPTE